MKNKVDIGKLIEKKYKGNTLELSDILEQIDLVLQENITNYEYRREGEPGYLEEDPRQGIKIANAVNGNSVPIQTSIGAPRQEMPGNLSRDPQIQPQVIPDKIAEAEQETKKQAKSYTVQVPDIFSLISNSQFDPNSDDTKLVQKIVKNLETEKGNWILRIQKINEYTQTAQQPVETKDIRKAISALIFLNLLKKLSFFVAQPGKLFEYILRPLIGTEAIVLGSVDQQIVDVTKESQGQVWDYSLKMFTGKESGFTLKGSKANLEDAVLKRGRPITYIVSVSNQERHSLEFSECLVTTIPEHLPPGEWKPINVLEGGMILVKDASVGVLIQTKENLEKLSKYGPQQTSKEEKPELFGPKAPKEKTAKVGVKNYTFEDVNQELQQLEPSIEAVKTTPDNTKVDYLIPNRQGVGIPEEEAKFISSLSNMLSVLNSSRVSVGSKEIKNLTIPNTNLTYGTSPNTIYSSIVRMQDSSKKLQTISDILQKASSHETALKNAQKQLSPQAEQPQIQQPQTELREAEEAIDGSIKKEKTQFSIPLKGVWQTIPNKILLNLGSPEEYNKQQLTIASEIAGNMSKALEAFQQLNINLVNFFATSKKQAKEGDFGNKAIENANTISTNVAAFQSEESKQDKNTPPEAE